MVYLFKKGTQIPYNDDMNFTICEAKRIELILMKSTIKEGLSSQNPIKETEISFEETSVDLNLGFL